MPRWSVCLVAATLAGVLALPAQAQWKWRDRNGQTQYSDLPPPAGTADKDILARPGGNRAPAAPPVAAAAASAATSAAAKSGDPELDARRKVAEQAEADKRKADEARLAAARAENCGRAREQLRTLDSGIRISRVAPGGEREVLDDAARAEASRQARQTIAADCR